MEKSKKIMLGNKVIDAVSAAKEKVTRAKLEQQQQYLDYLVKVNEGVIKDVKAEYIDPDHIREGGLIRRIDIQGTRNYIECFPDGSYRMAPSVTRIIHTQAPTSYGLTEFNLNNTKEKVKWILEHSANYGTFLHIMFSRIVLGESMYLSDEFFFTQMRFIYEENGFNYDEGKKWYDEQGRDVKKDIYGFLCFIRDYKVKPLAVEYPFVLSGYKCQNCGNVWQEYKLYCPVCGFKDIEEIGLYSGTIDLVAMLGTYGDAICVIDYKSRLTDFYESDTVQLYAYMTAWNSKNPDLKADCCVSYGCKNYRLPVGKTVKPYRIGDMTQGNEKFTWKWWSYLRAFHHDSKNLEIPTITGFDPMQKVDIDSDLSGVFIDINPLDVIVQSESKQAF